MVRGGARGGQRNKRSATTGLADGGANAGAAKQARVTPGRVGIQAAKTSLSEIEQHAYDWIVDYLLEQSNRVELLYIKGMLESGKVKNMMSAAGMQGNNDKLAWADSYTQWRQIPKYWLADAVVTLTTLSMEFLDAMDAAKPGQFRAFCQWVFGFDDSKNFPRKLLDKETMLEWLRIRLAELGNRWTQVATFMQNDHVIDWEAASPYRLTWALDADGAKIDSITHKLTNETTAVKAVRLEQGLEVSYPWSDTSAMFTGNPCTKPLAMDLFFGDKKWEFKKHFTKTRIEEVVTEALANVSIRATTQLSGREDILQSAQKTKMSKARSRKAPSARPGFSLSMPAPLNTDIHGA